MEIYTSAEFYEVVLPIENRLGLHARPAMKVLEILQEYGSDVGVAILKDGRADEQGDVDGKEIMQLMLLGTDR